MAPGWQNAPAFPDASARARQRRRPSRTSRKRSRLIAALKEDGIPVPKDRFDAILVAV